jgi:integrase
VGLAWLVLFYGAPCRTEARCGLLTSDNTQFSRPNGPLQNALVPASARVLDGVRTTVSDYVRAALSESTRRAYKADLRHFLDWGGSIPATDRTVSEYLAAHAERLCVATLVRRLVSIGKVHTTQGLTSPTSSELVRLTMRGIRHKHGRPQRRVAAAVKDDILAMVAGLGGELKDCRDRALLLMGFAGAFRRSELIAIDCTAVERVPQGIVVALRRSKTDQQGDGRRIGIPYARGVVCPVKALDAWLTASGVSDGPIFRSVNRHGGIGAKALSAEAVALIVKRRAGAAGLDASNYAGHSLRAGLATSAAAAGVPSWKIKVQTGHASDTMLHRYIRDGELFVGNAVAAVL